MVVAVEKLEHFELLFAQPDGLVLW